ncbi:hypothetical protein ACWD0A_07840 [Streptomyces sp. NPDC002867]
MNATSSASTNLFFSDYFEIDPKVIEGYGAFDISVVSDMPLFIDPFLLFNSDKEEYQALHEQIIIYLRFLRDRATSDLEPGLIKNWYQFKEVKQNWLGFTLFGNEGRALGKEFAASLHSALGKILSNFGDETVTKGTHLEKLTLVTGKVGRDCISDFTTNLIKHYLLTYTQEFAHRYMRLDQCRHFSVQRAAFNYNTESWETRRYYLPELRGDFILLTPLDLLTRDDTWISHAEMISRFDYLPQSVSDPEVRGQINNYFRSLLGKKPTARDRAVAAQKVINQFPELIDLYIRNKEDEGVRAAPLSLAKALDARDVLVNQVKKAIPDIESKTDFYEKPWTSFDEALERVGAFKHYVEHQDGYQVINRAGQPFSKETEVQLFFGLIWCKTDFDVNREPNNGRGPVDFKVSFGSGDKSLIEFKLAKSSSLKRNLQNQVEIYQKANNTHKSVKVIICYTEEDELRAKRILRELDLERDPAVVLIDARSDNKPSASKA